jgi:predicted nucleic acid-binding protein
MCGRSDHACEDALIAATARACGLTLVTRNARDFAHFDVPVFDPVAFAGHG